MQFDEDGLPILDQFSEEGFIDCVFRIEMLKSDDNYYYFNLIASKNSKKVGFAVKMIRKIEPGFDSEMNLIRDHVYDKGVSFRSLGRISDDLISELAELYGLGCEQKVMVSEESYTAIALHQDDTEFESNPVKIKLFGRDSEPFIEEEYYESFFNVDLSSGFVFWNEKDQEYRSALISALSVV